MNLGIYNIDSYLTWTVNTHNPTTNAASDADSVPSYRIYEDETGTPITTGTMALLDSASTTGFYSERVQLTSGLGFEIGKSYNIYVEATVSSVVGTLSHHFQVGEIEQQTWNATLGDYSGSSGSTAEQLASISAAGIADAVWDELTSGHAISGSFGEAIGEIAADVWTQVIDSGAPANAQTATHLMRLFASALLGLTDNTGHDWGARDLGDSKYRIEASLNTSGFRTQITTLDGS